MLISNANVNIASILNNPVIEGNSSAASQSINVNNILSSLGITAGNIPGASAGPTLAAPVSSLSAQAVMSFLKTSADEKALSQDLNAIANNFADKANSMMQSRSLEQKVEIGKTFDISGMSSSAVSLLAAANALMLSLNAADTKLSGKLSLVSFDAAKTTAGSLVREGMDMLSGSISQSALQLGITGIGAKHEFKGLQNERGALKHNGSKIDKLTAESHSIKDVLNGQNSVKLGAEGVDNMKTLNMKSQSGSLKNLNEANIKSNVSADATGNLGIKDSNKQLSPEHQAILSRRLESVESDIRLEQSAMDNTKLKAREQQMTGDMIVKGSMAVGGVAGAAGQHAAIVERSEQQISQVSNRVASTASDESRESARKSNSLIQEMLKTMESINQSKASAMAAIAGNIRA